MYYCRLVLFFVLQVVVRKSKDEIIDVDAPLPPHFQEIIDVLFPRINSDRNSNSNSDGSDGSGSGSQSRSERCQGSQSYRTDSCQGAIGASRLAGQCLAHPGGPGSSTAVSIGRQCGPLHTSSFPVEQCLRGPCVASQGQQSVLRPLARHEHSRSSRGGDQEPTPSTLRNSGGDKNPLPAKEELPSRPDQRTSSILNRGRAAAEPRALPGLPHLFDIYDEQIKRPRWSWKQKREAREKREANRETINLKKKWKKARKRRRKKSAPAWIGKKDYKYKKPLRT